MGMYDTYFEQAEHEREQRIMEAERRKENYEKRWKLENYAKENHKNCEYQYYEDTQLLIATRDNGAWVFEMSLLPNGDIMDKCLNQPLD